MQVLLDTHTLLWFFSGNENISITALQLIEDSKNLKYISLVSVWEMAIKQSKGRLNLSVPIDDYIQQKIQLADFKLLDIQLSHLQTVSSLPFHHNDPFDRLLIAQSMVKNIPIVSRDSMFDSYKVDLIW
ncbi:type II toxin-antitoxin system VapC family toxin [Anabaena sp. PCC 7108]|uniref:type II toxin-antitoxin system VapC family toxin n=1 Tax=Anabaena sp. PCC 7108 TaxID=163908 RepID=UPI000344EC8B|nr:type II toxin-antitoxin system VapC family toxin [Anabaena sp. PCC 7108]